MKFTGERFIPTEQGRIRLEHYHRYAAVQDIVAGKDVLDVACGEGYGSSLMANVARTVTGVDISDEAVQHAFSTYKKQNLNYRQGSATALDFSDAAFDVVVSFETIEHLTEQAQMLAEIRRLLRPDGVLVISSPNRPVYSEESGEYNEFHVKELDFNEFDELLKEQFPTIQYFGQRILMGSVLQALEGGQAAFRAWHDDGKDLKPNSGRLTEPVYFVALCGAKNIDLPKMDMSVLYPDNLDLVKHYVGFAKWAQTLDRSAAEHDIQLSRLNQAVSERDGQISNLVQAMTERDGHITSLIQAMSEREDKINSRNQTVSERDVHITSLLQAKTEQEDKINRLIQVMTERDGKINSHNQNMSERDARVIKLTDETVRRGEWAMRLNSELESERAKLSVITRSNSWLITKPLREMRRCIAAPIKTTKRYLEGGLRLAKRIYQSIPLSYQTKASHRNALAKYFPKLLLVSGSHSATISVLAIPAMEPLTSHALLDNAAFAKTIAVPRSENPLVSIIIPVYGQIDYTLRCLESIAKNMPLVEIEIIVVDDFSPDNSVEILTSVQGVHLICNTQNQGFIRSCNSGSKAAKGDYLYFLNNDTVVTSNWLDALLRTFHDFPGTGLVGSKLVYPDGRLQEAGGIIWQDGSAWNFGRLQDSQLPVYNYAREVDYCSGASIMVPKDLFAELGAFDEHYLPAYCEDCDLALKIRIKGFRVIYQPMSTVIHYEGITSGKDTSHGTKAYQVENTKKLYERWKSLLQTHQQAGVDVDNAKDRRATRRVLVLDHCTPTPNEDAGSLIIFNLLLLLREMDFQVTFIPEDNFLYMAEHTQALQRAGIEVLFAPYVTSVDQHLKEFGARYTLALLIRPVVVERHIKAIRTYCSKAKVLFHTVDLHFLRMSREAKLQSDNRKQKIAVEMKQRELAALRASDASIVVSTAELELLLPELPFAKLHVLPLIMDIQGVSKAFYDRKDIVFIGGFQHKPNVDAVRYFVTEIMPLLRQRLPGVRFNVVGSKPPADLQVLAAEDVIITGFVENLTALLDKMRVSVAPLRFGAGIKGKIGTAMAVGLPVVGTALAVEGMSLSDGENILVADGAKAFAEAVIKIYVDETLWNSISNKGLAFAGSAWGAAKAWQNLATVLADLGMDAKRGPHSLSLYSEFTGNEVKPPSQLALAPIAAIKSREDFVLFLQSGSITAVTAIERLLLSKATTEAFDVVGYCVPCQKQVLLLVDMISGGKRHAHGWTPNWRERLACPSCGMNNRQRLVATLVKQELFGKQGQKAYFMEQVTPIFTWALSTFKQHQLIGSEYLGHEYLGGTVVKGVRHEDVESLSFGDGEIDLIVSNDVFEHVPHPAQALAECARVLKTGGIMLATIPFHSGNDVSVIRASLSVGQVDHMLPPAFHGNPVSAEGSLVFTDFGWDVLNVMKVAGFSDVVVQVYASAEFGHLGGGQLVFKLTK